MNIAVCMPDQPSPPPKPITEVWRPELVALPRLTFGRRFVRAFLRGFSKLLAFVTMRLEVTVEGSKIWTMVVINHLGDADVVRSWQFAIPFTLEGIGKIDCTITGSSDRYSASMVSSGSIAASQTAKQSARPWMGWRKAAWCWSRRKAGNPSSAGWKRAMMRHFSP
jgi:hypothetical protein